MNYAQLHTPDGSKSEISTGHSRDSADNLPGLVAREIETDEVSINDIEAAPEETKVVYVDDSQLSCGGLLGRCPLIALFSFVVCGILIGIGLSQLLVCQRSETVTWCEF